MKKLFMLIAVVLNANYIFSQNIFYRYNSSTWYTLSVYAILFLSLISYLFVRYRLEQSRQSKDPQGKMNTEPTHDLKSEGATDQNGSGDIFRLFMLKRKGVITEFEYHQMKMRALKRKKNSFENIDELSMAR